VPFFFQLAAALVYFLQMLPNLAGLFVLIVPQLLQLVLQVPGFLFQLTTQFHQLALGGFMSLAFMFFMFAAFAFFMLAALSFGRLTAVPFSPLAPLDFLALVAFAFGRFLTFLGFLPVFAFQGRWVFFAAFLGRVDGAWTPESQQYCGGKGLPPRTLQNVHRRSSFSKGDPGSSPGSTQHCYDQKAEGDTRLGHNRRPGTRPPPRASGEFQQPVHATSQPGPEATTGKGKPTETSRLRQLSPQRNQTFGQRIGAVRHEQTRLVCRRFTGRTEPAMSPPHNRMPPHQRAQKV
jgi:hypothetical protein